MRKILIKVFAVTALLVIPNAYVTSNALAQTGIEASDNADLESLDLTPDQRDRLRAFAQEEMRRRNAAGERPVADDLREAYRRTGEGRDLNDEDLQRLRRGLQERSRRAGALREILTPEQMERLQDRRRALGERMHNAQREKNAQRIENERISNERTQNERIQNVRRENNMVEADRRRWAEANERTPAIRPNRDTHMRDMGSEMQRPMSNTQGVRPQVRSNAPVQVRRGGGSGGGR